ncbi:MAG: rhomboid family intramembrane serine protease [Myxococcales bacterium]|nr:rhomboid family intramembrane serine protease [Myxococcales bacterium]
MNSASEKRCFQCKQPLPGPLGRASRDLVKSLLGDELWVTKLFIGINVLSFVLMLLDNGRAEGASLPMGFGGGGGLTRSALLRAGVLNQLVVGEWWRFLSAVFFHFSVLHILFNMMWLGILGRSLEPELGSARFTITYLLAGIGGFLGNLLLGPMPWTGGASGSVFGLFGALVGYSLGRKNSMWRDHMTRLIIFVVLSWVIGGGMGGGGVNNVAHVGGALVGIAMGYLFGVERRYPLTHRVLGYVAVLGVGAVIASLVLCQISPTWEYVRQLESQQDMW